MIINGDCLEELDKLEANSIDAIVTDPPYELNFMGKGWDNAGVSFSKSTWEKCLRVLKPGGYLLAFGGTRTYHRIACAIEDAGFEIRDCIMWLYGSGFPKSMNIGLAVDKKLGVDNRTGKVAIGAGNNNTVSMNSGVKKSSELKHEYEYEERKAQNEWNGWGTCLKPSYEPIIVARKPFKGSLVDNVMEYGVGGLNIDECRIAHNEPQKFTNRNPKDGEVFNTDTSGYDNTKNHIASASPNGRFPANTILTYDDTDFDEVCGGFPQSKGGSGKGFKKDDYGFGDTATNFKRGDFKPYNDDGSAARYFYCAKASKKDRDEGLDDFILTEGHRKGNGLDRVCEFCGIPQLKAEDCHCPVKSWVAKPKKNNHPTVKPTSLMQYLIRLVSPKGSVILDPFMGSGSTGKAVMYENKERNADYAFIGIEKEAEYCKIAEARISAVK